MAKASSNELLEPRITSQGILSLFVAGTDTQVSKLEIEALRMNFL